MIVTTTTTLNSFLLNSFFFSNTDKNNDSNSSSCLTKAKKIEAEKMIDEQKNEPPKKSNDSDFMNISDLLGGFITSYVYSAIIYLVYSLISTLTMSSSSSSTRSSIGWIVVSFGLAIMITYVYKLISVRYKQLWILQIFTLCLLMCFSVGICSVLSLLNSYMMAFIIFLACLLYTISDKTHKLTRYCLFVITILSPVLLAWMYTHWLMIFELAFIFTLTKIGFSVFYLDDVLHSSDNNRNVKNDKHCFQSYFITLVLCYQIIYPLFMYWNDFPTLGTVLSFFIVDHINSGTLDSGLMTFATDNAVTFLCVLVCNLMVIRGMYAVCLHQFKRLKLTVIIIKKQDVSIHDFWHYVAAIR